MSWKDTGYNTAVFGIIMDGVVVAMDASGYFNTLGINITPLPSVDRINNTISSFEPGQGVGDTLFALFNVFGNAFLVIPDFLFAFPNMFTQLALDGWLVDLIFTAQYLFWFAAVAYIFIGRRF